MMRELCNIGDYRDYVWGIADCLLPDDTPKDRVDRLAKNIMSAIARAAALYDAGLLYRGQCKKAEKITEEEQANDG